jgi:hypothetical protein
MYIIISENIASLKSRMETVPPPPSPTSHPLNPRYTSLSRCPLLTVERVNEVDSHVMTDIEYVIEQISYDCGKVTVRAVP